MQPVSRSDRVALVAIACLTVVAVVLGVKTAYREVDVDEVVFRDTLVSMREGQGYYPAMRDALVRKEGAPPSQVRSVRPPTVYLFLSRFPASSWRYVVGAVYLSASFLAWRLGRPLHPAGGPVAVTLVGLWVLGSAPLLFLHAELWGLPFLLAGVLALRSHRWTAAAVSLALAALIREIYLIPLVIGLVVADRRRAWLPALAVVGMAGALHFNLASDVLSAGGREPRFGASGLGLDYILSAISPSDRPLGWLVGVGGLILGTWGLHRRWSGDVAARLLLAFSLVMVPLTILFGRQYWGLTFGPALACYVPAALSRVGELARVDRSDS